MSSGFVDGSVVDRARGELILSLLLPVVRLGSQIRVSSKKVTVDTSRCEEYPRESAEPGEAGDPSVPSGS